MLKSLRWPFRLQSQSLVWILIAAAMLGVAWHALDIANRLAKTNESAARSDLILSSLERLRNQVEESEAARLDFVSAGEERSVRRSRQAMREGTKTLDVLRDSIVGMEQRSDLKVLERQTVFLFNLAQDDAVLRRQGDASAEVGRDNALQAELALQRCRTMIMEMKSSVLRAQERSRQREGDDQSALTSTIIIAAGLLLVLLFSVRQAYAPGGRSVIGKETRGSAAAAASADGVDGCGLGDLGNLVQSGGNIGDAIHNVSRHAMASFAGCSGALYLAQEPGDKLEIKAAWGKDSGCGGSFDASECRVMRCADADLAVATGIVCARRPQSARLRTVCTPVKAHGAVLGVLMLQEGTSVERLACPAAQRFPGRSGLALVSMNLRDTLHKLSGHEPLAASGLSRPLAAGHEPRTAGHEPGSAGHGPGSAGHGPGSAAHAPGSIAPAFVGKRKIA